MHAHAPRSFVIRLRSGASCGAVALVTAACLALTATGCLSNEYEIRKDELRRLAQVAPDARGQSVRVSQTLGDRRSDAVDPAIPAPIEALETPDPSSDVSLRLDGGVGGAAAQPARRRSGLMRRRRTPSRGRRRGRSTARRRAVAGSAARRAAAGFTASHRAAAAVVRAAAAGSASRAATAAATRS